MPYLTVRDYRMYYEDHGTGDPLVLLHSGLATSAQWVPFIPVYARRYRVLATDRRGYGRSDPRPGFAAGYLHEDASDLATFLDLLGVTGARVLGHSDGGTVALVLAAARPDLVRSMVLVAAHTHAEEKTLEGLRRAQALLQSSPAQRERLVRHLGPGGPALAEAWYGHWLDPEQRGLEIRELIRSIRVPTLVIQGVDDEFATPAHAEGIARAIPGAELWLIPNCGHNPQFQMPEAFNERVLGFLGEY
ncbi:MAG: alpha/beta hydrolase [Anaerolineae bacterium]|nr:alpha/beta hydrolase [Anaerolineae bacterium]